MPAKNALRTTKHLFSGTDSRGSTAVMQVADFVGDVLAVGVASEIRILDDRGGQGTINVFVTKPKE